MERAKYTRACRFIRKPPVCVCVCVATTENKKTFYSRAAKGCAFFILWAPRRRCLRNLFLPSRLLYRLLIASVTCARPLRNLFDVQFAFDEKQNDAIVNHSITADQVIVIIVKSKKKIKIRFYNYYYPHGYIYRFITHTVWVMPPYFLRCKYRGHAPILTEYCFHTTLMTATCEYLWGADIFSINC